MTKTALITGASGGIGYEMAKIMASDGVDLVLVSRNIEKLNALKLELEANKNISVHICAIDLSLENAPVQVKKFTDDDNLKIDYLVNNAGFGLFGAFHETDWEKEAEMIRVNITSLTQLCKIYIPEMVMAGKGKILNVASTAAFVPGPFMSVYFATKAYVLSFSEALHAELKPKNITVTTLCPGPTKSGFFETAGIKDNFIQNTKFSISAKGVAKIGYKAMLRGKTVVISGVMNKTLMGVAHFTPRNIVRKFIHKFIQKN